MQWWLKWYVVFNFGFLNSFCANPYYSMSELVEKVLSIPDPPTQSCGRSNSPRSHMEPVTNRMLCKLFSSCVLSLHLVKQKPVTWGHALDINSKSLTGLIMTPNNMTCGLGAYWAGDESRVNTGCPRGRLVSRRPEHPESATIWQCAVHSQTFLAVGTWTHHSAFLVARFSGLWELWKALSGSEILISFSSFVPFLAVFIPITLPAPVLCLSTCIFSHHSSGAFVSKGATYLDCYKLWKQLLCFSKPPSAKCN